MGTIPPGLDLNKIPAAPPPEGLIPNFVDPPSLAPVVTAVCCAMIVLEVFFGGIRFYISLSAQRKLGYDDFCCLCAIILTFGLSFCLLYLRPFERHRWDIPLSSVTPAMWKIIFSIEAILGPTIFAGKTSLLLFYYRVFSSIQLVRYKIYGGIIVCGLFQLAMVPVVAAFCAPEIGQSWGLESATADIQRCNKSLVYGVIQGTANVTLDVFILYLPIPVVLGLNLSTRRKLGVLAIFMTGILAIIASIVGLLYRIRLYKSIDSAWAGIIAAICGLVEAGISVICSSMPSMAAFSKTVSFPRFSSLRSRLSTSKSRLFNRSKGTASAKHLPTRSPRPNSFTHLHDRGYIELNGDRKPTDQLHGRPTSNIESAVSEIDVEYSGSQQSVRMEQSSVE